MARSCVIWWICSGWLLLCGLLPSVEAATRTTVNLPSFSSAINASTTSKLSGGTLSLGGVPLEGEFIAAATGNVPVRGILGGVEFGLRTVSSKATGLLRGNIAGLLAGAAVSKLLDGVDWVMTDGGLAKHSAAGPVDTTSGQFQWSGMDTITSNPTSACMYVASHSGISVQSIGATPFHGSQTIFLCTGTGTASFGPLNIQDLNFTVNRTGDGCPSAATYNSLTGTCVAPATYAPISDSDSKQVADYLGKQDPAWIKSLIKELCAGASGGASPDSCYRDMSAKSPVLIGPTNVTGGTTNTSTTVANSDGTTSQTNTATTTNYALTYGDTYFDSNKSTSTTVMTDGKQASTTTTTEDPTTTTDAKDSSSTPATCTSADCTAPAYQSLYTKTTDTKEGALDSYASKVSALPIVHAVGGFFTVSVGGGCPVWSVDNNFQVFSATMPIHLVMDQQCQPWFTSTASYAKIAILIVAAYLAFRIAILD